MEEIILKADHLQNEKKVKASGRLYESNGIYQMGFSWMEPDGTRGRKSKSTGLPVKGNKKRAESIMSTERKALEEKLNQRAAPGAILFADFMEHWLDVIKPELKQTTYGGYCYNVKSIIAPWFRAQQIYLQDLTADDIEEFYEDQMLRVKGASVYKYHANISKALKYAVRKHLIPYSVMGEVVPPKKDRFIGKFLTQNEAVRLFDAVKGHKLELGVILGTYYGLRRGEILGLRWDAIDFEANTISIGHTVTPAQVDGKRVLIEEDTAKTDASIRTLPLIPVFRAKLLEVREEQQSNQKLCGKSYNKAHRDYIYTDTIGKRIMPDYLSREFPAFLVAHGFRRMRFHDTRHSCASLLLASGVPLKQIQEWLGHKNFSITADTYAHLEYQSKQSSADAMKWIHKTELGKQAGEALQPI
jgi:integrase